MVVIRLSRVGSKKRPIYHIVAADKRYPRDGRYIERIGYFNPLVKENGATCRLKISKDRVDYWLSVGAQLSARAKSLIKEWHKSDVAKSLVKQWDTVQEKHQVN